MVSNDDCIVSPTKLYHISESDSSVLSAGSGKTFTWVPGINVIWQIVGFRFYCNAIPGSASGTHSLTIKTPITDIIQGASVFNSTLTWLYSGWQTADSTQYPSDSMTALFALQNMRFDNDNPLRTVYINYSDVSHSNIRYYDFFIQETLINI